MMINADPPKSRITRSLQPPNRNAGPRGLLRYDAEVLSMSENVLETIARLEKLAAWHWINAERAGADWVWEARLRTAEDLERQAAKIRASSAALPTSRLGKLSADAKKSRRRSHTKRGHS